MDYIASNKEAWEEAFENRSIEWDKGKLFRLRNEDCPYLEKEMGEELKKFDFTNSTIAQFCCNDGRELLSITKLGAKQAVGFDIAENMISYGNSMAKELGVNCRFEATDILQIEDKYNNYFDYLFITIGALGWFKELPLFFNKVAACLKEGGKLIINEMHPVTNMLGASGEENYDIKAPNKLVNSYFKKEPWIENKGIGYITGKSYKSKTFTSYSYTFSDLLNALIENGIHIKKLREFDYDISGLFDILSGKGIPLSYILIGEKL